MKCANCGAEGILDDSAFCPDCGAQLAPAIDGASGQQMAGSASPSRTTPVASVPPAAGSATGLPPTAQMQVSTLPMQGGSASPAPAVAAPQQASGVSMKVFVVLVAVIVVLIVVVLLLVMRPFGNDEESDSRQGAASVTSATVTMSTPTTTESSQSASSESAQAEQPVEEQQPVADPEATHGLQAESTPTEQAPVYEQEQLYYNAPFWGAFIGSFTYLDNAQNYLAEAQAKGLPAVMLESTDWDNLNPTHYWVITIGTSATQAEAQQWCEKAKAAGYADAYVKYSGNHR